MAAPLTFSKENLIDSAVVGPDGAVYYTTSTTKGLLGRKETTITAASGLLGLINWREKAFVINGVQKEWDDLKERSAGIFRFEREWTWGNKPYKLKYHDLQKELLVRVCYYFNIGYALTGQATPTTGNSAGTVRFTIFQPHLLRDNERATICFPPELSDEVERMFLLMAILQTEMHRQDIKEAAEGG
ncbi:hypothetical protein B0H19DRAFT_1192913 [Mycena capillaripes]|nr:hypothetical protein B0H19DRAFT_1192913 [Mycena capillaripes]